MASASRPAICSASQLAGTTRDSRVSGVSAFNVASNALPHGELVFTTAATPFSGAGIQVRSHFWGICREAQMENSDVVKEYGSELSIRTHSPECSSKERP